MTGESPRRIDTALLVAWALRLLAVFILGYYTIYRTMHIEGVDFPKHWDASIELLNGRSPYIDELYLAFNYPLFTGFVYLHLGFFSLETARHIWNAQNLVFVLLSIVLLAWGLRPSPTGTAPPGFERYAAVTDFMRRYWGTVVLLAIVSCQPLQRVMMAGNVDPLSLVLSSLFCALLWRGRETWAGAGLAAFALVKVAPILLLIPLAAAGRWRVVGGCVGALCLYAVMILLLGLGRTELFLYTDVLPAIPHHWYHISHSFHRVLAEHVFPSAIEDGDLYRRVVLLVNVALLAGFGVFLWMWRRNARRDADALLVFGFIMVLAMTPLLEINHLVWVAPAFVLLLRVWLDGRCDPRWFVLALIGWIGILKMDTLIHLYFKLKPPIPYYTVSPLLLVYLLVVMGGLALTARRQD